MAQAVHRGNLSVILVGKARGNRENNWFAKPCDFKMCREARDYYLTNDELSLDNNASLW